MSRFKNYKRKLRWKSSIRKEGNLPWWHDPSEEEEELYGKDLRAPMDPSCPKCSSPMYWRDAAGLTGLHPEGAWECSNQRCWHMMPPGTLAPDTLPDPDTGHSDLTLPEGWQ